MSSRAIGRENAKLGEQSSFQSGSEQVVDELARVSREERRLVRALGEPCRGEVGAERLALGDADEGRGAGERESAGCE